MLVEAVKALIPILLTLSLGGVVLSVGLRATQNDLLYVVRRPKKLLKAVLAVIVIPPVVAGMLVSVLPLATEVKAGIMLMAVSPVPPLLPGKELKVGGRKEYAFGVYAAMTILSIVSVPIVLAIASSAFGRHDLIPVSLVAAKVFASVVAPLAIGLLVRRFAPVVAERTWAAVCKLSMVALLFGAIPIFVIASPAMASLVGNGSVLAMAITTALTLAAGHLLGGPDHRRAGANCGTAARREFRNAYARAGGGARRQSARRLDRGRLGNALRRTRGYPGI
jgi:BASS family bile acid:Na+ symporter